MQKVKKIVLLLLGAVYCASPVWAGRSDKVGNAFSPEKAATEQQFTYYLYAAHSALDAGHYDDALALSEFAYRLNPTDPTICYFLGVLYEGTNRTEEALQRYQTAYEGSPTDYWLRYFSILYKLDDRRSHQKAMKVIQTEYKRQPDDAQVLDTYQEVLVAEGQFRKALQVQDRIDRVEGRTPQNVLRRYRLLLLQGKGKEAVQVVENYCKEDPDDYYFQALLGDVYLAIGQKEQAMKTYLKAMHDYPENPYIYQSLARVYKQQKDAKGERLALEKLIEIAPNDETLQRYYELLNEDTVTSDQQRRDFIQKAYLLEPESPRWHYYWALVLAGEDSLQASLDVCAEGISLSENDPRTRFSLLVISGDLNMRLGEIDSCFNCYEQALMIDPENVYVLNNYAYTLAIHGGDLNKAEKMSQKTIQKEPNNPTYLDTYAWILHLQGQDILAKFYMRQAMEKAGEHADDPEMLEHYKILIEN